MLILRVNPNFITKSDKEGMAPDSELSDLIAQAKEISEKRFGKEINFYYTGADFPAVSVTGSSCALDCRHCKKKLIERLPPAKTPQDLLETCISLWKKGAAGVLITGGCTAEGKVPLAGFLGAVKKIKQETRMKVIVHTGLVDYGEAREIKEAGIDGVCVDVVGSPETTREIYNIEIAPYDYLRTLKALQEAGIRNISPHVCVGLHFGRLHHELAALEIISSIKPSNVVIIGLTDIVGTPMEDIKINPHDFLKVLCNARLMFPESYVSLGCARGKGCIREEIDRLSVRAGVNNIALPTQAAYDEARKLGLTIREHKACCALLPEELI